MRERHSDQIFAEGRVDRFTVDALFEAAELCQSSCDRKAVHLSIVDDRDRLALLGGTLVGGVGWIHRAPLVLLLWADPIAYRAGNEIEWMPYLDAGVVVQQLYLTATALGLKCCFVNPNIRDINWVHFHRVFSPAFGDPEDPRKGVFCGAMALGWPRKDESWTSYTDTEPLSTDTNSASACAPCETSLTIGFGSSEKVTRGSATESSTSPFRRTEEPSGLTP